MKKCISFVIAVLALGLSGVGCEYSKHNLNGIKVEETSNRTLEKRTDPEGSVRAEENTRTAEAQEQTDDPSEGAADTDSVDEAVETPSSAPSTPSAETPPERVEIEKCQLISVSPKDYYRCFNDHASFCTDLFGEKIDCPAENYVLCETWSTSTAYCREKRRSDRTILRGWCISTTTFERVSACGAHI